MKNNHEQIDETSNLTDSFVANSPNGKIISCTIRGHAGAIPAAHSINELINSCFLGIWEEIMGRILQVSNISPSATKDEIQTLFSHIGRIDECRLYPSNSSATTVQTQPKFAFIKFEKEKSVNLGQHLTNVVFIDRVLICVPALSNTIPDEETALHEGIAAPAGQRQLPADVKNEERDYGDGHTMIETVDPTLTALGLPTYPALPASTDAAKIEEIRRTIYIGNLEKDCDGEELMKFINATMGEVMYMRMAAGNEYLPCDYAFVEFSNIRSVAQALQNNGLEYNGRPLRITHSRVAIIKPQRKTADQALEEVEEAIKINEGKSTIATTSVSPSRRRSPSPRRRSRDRDDRRHSRSPRRRRSKSRKRSQDRRSSSRDRHDRRRSKDRDRRSSSRDGRRSKRSRSRDHKHDKERREKERTKEKERERRDRDRKREKRSRSRTPKKSRKEKTRDKIDQPMESEEEVLRERLLERVKRKRDNSGERNGTEFLLADFKPEPMDTDN